jgi:hypothetical protein
MPRALQTSVTQILRFAQDDDSPPHIVILRSEATKDLKIRISDIVKRCVARS